jgi:hypothetical protein
MRIQFALRAIRVVWIIFLICSSISGNVILRFSAGKIGPTGVFWMSRAGSAAREMGPVVVTSELLPHRRSPLRTRGKMAHFQDDQPKDRRDGSRLRDAT